jgi:hypothetical protein
MGRNSTILRALTACAALTLAGQFASAADIFVRGVRGGDVSAVHASEVTDMIKSAVRAMPEHSLAAREGGADFVIQPRLISREGRETLRLERYKNGTLISSTEEDMDTLDSDHGRALQITQNLMQTDSYVKGAASQIVDRTSWNTKKQSPQDFPASDQGTSLNAPSNQKVDRTADRATDLTADRPMDSSADHASDRAIDRSTENTADRSMDRPSDRTSDRPMERAGSESLSSQTIPPQNREPSATTTTPDAAALNSAPVYTGGTASTDAAGGGESRAISPRHSLLGGPGYFTAGAGAGFAAGLNSDTAMYNVDAGYNVDVTPEFTARGFADLNLGTGANGARFIDLGVGGNYYAEQLQTKVGRPYVTGDLGFAFARDADNRTLDGFAVGAGAGFQFEMNNVNLDLNAHYTVLTSLLRNANPQIIGVRLAVNF